MIPKLSKRQWTKIPLVVIMAMTSFASYGCWLFGGGPDPADVAEENGRICPHVMQIQPCFCFHACLVANICYYFRWSEWDQWQIENAVNPDHSCGLSMQEGIDFMQSSVGLDYDLVALHWNHWTKMVMGTIGNNGLIISPVSAAHIGTIMGYTYSRDNGEFNSFLVMDPAQYGGSGSWGGCYEKITLQSAINWFPVYTDGLHGICLASRIFIPDTLSPTSPLVGDTESAGIPGRSMSRSTPYGGYGEKIEDIPPLPFADGDGGCNGECPPADTLRWILANIAMSIALEQDTVLLPILINTMTWHQISGIHPGPLYGVSDPVGAMSTKQGTDPEIGFSKNLAAQGFKSYAAAVAKLGCEGFGEVTEMPMGYYMQTLLDGDGNEFVTMLFHPIGLEFAGYCFYPSSLLTAKMSAEIPAKLDVKTRIRLQELAADIAQRWEESPMISDSPGINMFSIQDIEAQGLHAHMFFEWGTDALPFRPFIEVTDGNHDVVGIYNRFGVEYARDEDGVLYRVDDIDYSRSTGGAGVPTTFGLSQNYPNPFNAATNIEFALPEDGRVKLEIYDILGQRVRTLVDEYRAAGTYSVEFDSGSLASGMYFYRLIAGDFAETKKMVLMK